MDAALAGLGQALRGAGADTVTRELAAAVLAQVGRDEEAVESVAKTLIFPA
jgi:hypothetical protein